MFHTLNALPLITRPDVNAKRNFMEMGVLLVFQRDLMKGTMVLKMHFMLFQYISTCSIGRGYRLFDNIYVDFENATEKCNSLGAR